MKQVRSILVTKSPEDGSGTTAVEPFEHLKSNSGSEKEMDSPDRGASSRERRTTLQNVRLPPPSNSDSTMENRSESNSHLNQKESSIEPQTFSSQKLKEHVKIDVGGDKKPKQID
ncbi:hypothetical protein TNCV_3067851 [Trichonephila clavipes]|nr:hypothetical protein TNCV_3067851 [Trichonephila clavipes]